MALLVVFSPDWRPWVYQIVCTYIPVPLFSSSHPIYSTPSLSDTAGVGIVLGNPENITTWTAKFFRVSVPKHGIDEGRRRFVVVNKGSLLGEISSTKHLLSSQRGGPAMGVCFMIKAIPMKTFGSFAPITIIPILSFGQLQPSHLPLKTHYWDVSDVPNCDLYFLINFSISSTLEHTYNIA